MLHTTHLVFKLPDFHESYAPPEFKKFFKNAIKEINTEVKKKRTFADRWHMDITYSGRDVMPLVHFCNEVAKYNYPRHSLTFSRITIGRSNETIRVILQNKLNNL